MKKVFVYIALSVYVFAQVKPLAVIAEDFLAHTFWCVQHMATVHFENGKYHVHAELNDLHEKENKTPQQKIDSSEKIVEITAKEFHQLNFIEELNAFLIPANIYQSQDVLAGFTRTEIPPPKTQA